MPQKNDETNAEHQQSEPTSNCSGGILSPDGHDFIEVNHECVVDLTTCAAYHVTRACKECDSAFHGVKIVGEKPETKPQFKTLLYELYANFYDNPRGISHLVMLHLLPDELDTGTQTSLAGYLGAAVDLGCRDATENNDKRTKTDVIDFLLPETF